MTNQESKKILQRDLAILIENKSLPDSIEAMKVAISALGAIEQYKWERDVAVSQLKEIGVEFGEKTDKIQKVINKQIPIKADKVEVQPYFRKHFADKYTCPICHKEIRSTWNGCPYCLQAIDFSD